jgi:hypothetical protein
VGTPSVNIATFQTKVFVGAGRGPTVTLGAGCFFKDTDLSSINDAPTANLNNAGVTTKFFTLHWYILNVGGKAYPDNVPVIAVVIAQ